MYNPKSCNALEKPFYTPVAAALRWCNLIAHEIDILNSVGVDPVPEPALFPQWPCLRSNAEKILDAILNNELPYGRDGSAISPGDHVAKHRRTVRHSDLKAWMAKHYPDQKPAFLFDEVERNTHAAVTLDTWQALQAERDALKARVEKAETLYREHWSKIETERDYWRTKYEQADAAAKPSHLLAIAALLELLKTPVERPRLQGQNQEAIKEEILQKFPWRGLGIRSLDTIFSAANKAKEEIA